MIKFVPVRFKCKCLGEEQTAMVRERAAPEDILDWMEEVREAIGLRHAQLSPRCRESTMEYAAIPLPADGGGIGHLTKLQS